MFDEDKKQDGTIKSGAQQTHTKLSALVTNADHIEYWPIDLEHCYGIPRDTNKIDNPAQKASPNFQEAALKSSTDRETDYPLLSTAINAISSWISRV